VHRVNPELGKVISRPRFPSQPSKEKIEYLSEMVSHSTILTFSEVLFYDLLNRAKHVTEFPLHAVLDAGAVHIYS